MNWKRLYENQRTAASAIDLGICFLVCYFGNGFLGLLVMAYGIWCYYDGGRRLSLLHMIRQQGENP